MGSVANEQSVEKKKIVKIKFRIGWGGTKCFLRFSEFISVNLIFLFQNFYYITIEYCIVLQFFNFKAVYRDLALSNLPIVFYPSIDLLVRA
jgi:hypothetical protein